MHLSIDTVDPNPYMILGPKLQISNTVDPDPYIYASTLFLFLKNIISSDFIQKARL